MQGGTGQALIGKQESQTSKRYYYKKTCYFCGENGHFFKDCPKYLHQKSFKSKHKAKSACMVLQGESHSDSESDEKVFGAYSQCRRTSIHCAVFATYGCYKPVATIV